MTAGGKAGYPAESGAGLAASDEVRTFRASDHELERGRNSGGSSLAEDGCRHRRNFEERGEGRLGEVEEETRLERDDNGENKDSLDGAGKGGVAAAVSEDVQENRSSMGTLVPPGNEAGDGGAFELSTPMQLVVKRGSMPLLEEISIKGNDGHKERQGGGGGGDGGVGGAEEAGSDDEDDDENSFSSFSRRQSRSFSQVSAAGRRASVGIRRQVDVSMRLPGLVRLLALYALFWWLSGSYRLFRRHVSWH